MCTVKVKVKYQLHFAACNFVYHVCSRRGFPSVLKEGVEKIVVNRLF